MRWDLALLLATLAVTTACGDVGRVTVSLTFPSEDIESRTRGLLFKVRQIPPTQDGCNDLWPMRPTSLPQSVSVVPYPNRTDLVAAPIELTGYEFLDIFVYAHPSTDVEGTSAIAGGCVMAPIDANGHTDVLIALDPSPF